MSRENVEVVREIYRGWSRGDFRVAREHFAADCEYILEIGPDRSRVNGWDGMRVAWGEHLRNWEEWRTGEIEELHDLGDSVLAIHAIRGRGRRSGVEVAIPRAAAAFRFRNGRIVRLLATDRLGTALEGLGISEDALPRRSGDLAREVLDAISRRDAEELVSLSHPDVEWRSFFAIGEGGVYRGHDGTRRYLRDLDDAFDIGSGADVDDVIAVGDVALLVGRLHYRGKGSAVEGETPAGWMLKFRDGKLVLFRAFREPEQALEAVGLDR